MAAYYNEFDPQAAAWLRELIRRGLIAPGDVDTRSIVDVRPDDLRGYTQCHFFACIGVWSYALRCAGWSDDRPVWTGSPPCQPFSAAGKGLGTADERHLWPAFFHLIDVCRPDTFFGEQVASKDALAWLDHVSADVEGAGYAFGAFDLCAAGFGAPHIRQRLKFVGTRAVGDAERPRLEGHGRNGDGSGEPGRVDPHAPGSASEGSEPGSLAFTDDAERRTDLSRGYDDNGSDAGRPQGAGDAGAGGAGSGVADAESDGWERCRELDEPAGRDGLAHGGAGTGGLADNTRGGRREERQDGRGVVVGDRTEGLTPGSVDGSGYCRPGPTNGRWGDADWLLCRDGKWRPVEPGTFPLAHGAAARVGRLRGYGNAIVAPAAQAFIEAFLDAESAGFADLGGPGGVIDIDGVLG